jgi:peptidoglycan/LPS O-acetylase OafA/YrhL
MSSAILKAPKHYNNFDFIRLVAAFSVWYVHCSIFCSAGAFGSLIPILSRGAVFAFFTVSGYFVTASFVNHQQRLLPYVRNRFLRIFPALCVVILLSTFVMGPQVTTLHLRKYFHSLETWHYLKGLLIFPMQYTLPGVFKDNLISSAINSPLWSLRYEVGCYIGVAVLGYFRVLHARMLLLIFTAFYLLSLYNYLGYLNWVTVVPFLSMPQLPLNSTLSLAVAFCPAFVGGAIMYLARDKIPVKGVYALAGLVLMALSYWLWGECLIYQVGFIYGVIYLGFAKIPLHHFTKYGDFSYGMYIYAWPIQQIFLQYNKHVGFLTFLAVTSVIAFLCAVLSWFYVEKPALSYKV